MRGAHSRQLAAWLGEGREHALEDEEPRLARLLERLGEDLEGDAGDLDVHLQGGDAVGGAGDLEVHVAEVVFDAGDIGEDDVGVTLLDEAHGGAGHRSLDLDAGVHQRQGGATHAGHRGRAVALEDLGDDARRVGEVELVGQHRHQGALGEGAVADVAALGAAHEAGLADRVRREVVVVDVALLVLDAEAVDALELAGATQRDDAQGLRLAAREEGAAVHARHHADLAGDLADLVGAAAVGAALLHRDAIAHEVSLDLGERALDMRHALVRRVLVEEGLDGGLLDRRTWRPDAPSCRPPAWRRPARRRTRCGPRRGCPRRRSTRAPPTWACHTGAAARAARR